MSKSPSVTQRWLTVIEWDSGYTDVTLHDSENEAIKYITEADMDDKDYAYVGELTRKVTVQRTINFKKV